MVLSRDVFLGFDTLPSVLLQLRDDMAVLRVDTPTTVSQLRGYLDQLKAAVELYESQEILLYHLSGPVSFTRTLIERLMRDLSDVEVVRRTPLLEEIADADIAAIRTEFVSLIGDMISLRDYGFCASLREFLIGLISDCTFFMNFLGEMEQEVFPELFLVEVGSMKQEVKDLLAGLLEKKEDF